MDSDFYVTLMSDSLPTNSIASFDVILPAPVALSRKYEVALTHLIYPYTFDVVRADRPNSSRESETEVSLTLQDGTIVTSHLDAFNYASADQLIDILNRQFFNILVKTKLINSSHTIHIWLYDEHSRKCIVEFPNSIMRAITLSPKISYLLGIPRILTRSMTGEYPVHTASPLMFIYSDVVDYQLVSNVRAQLLKIAVVKGKIGENIEISVNTPQYVNVLYQDLRKIHVEVKNELNELFDFHSGKICMILHFRPKQYTD